MIQSVAGIALAQLPVRVGDVAGNVERILAAGAEARTRGARLLLCPELCLLGYPADDLLQRRGLPALIRQGLDALIAGAGEMALVVGYPEFAEGVVYNAAAVLTTQGVIANYRKRALPNYGVFDDRRHFQPGDAPCVFEWQGQRLGLSICEDLWDGAPARQAVDAGAQLLLNLNASPFDQAKRARRASLLAERVDELGVPVLYANAVGGQDDVVFDGDSQIWLPGQGCILQAPAFEPGVFVAGDELPPPDEDALGLLYGALRLAVRDYVQRNGFDVAYVGLSGGIDSAVTLALAVDALGADRVRAVTMPSPYSAGISAADAQAQARAMGVDCRSIDILPAMQAYEAMLAPALVGTTPDTTEENLQARIRGALLMALANKFRGIVLTTGNKSEMAVGYCTLYGDMCGGFAPLKDVYKMQVYALARWRNAVSPVIPERVITRPPSAELRPDQKDEDSLPPYERLDAILAAYIEGEQSVAELYAAGFPVEEVDRVVRLVRLSEYKRRQAAPGPKVSTCAFGRERRYPLTATYPAI